MKKIILDYLEEKIPINEEVEKVEEYRRTVAEKEQLKKQLVNNQKDLSTSLINSPLKQ
jgi:hypothetical protein